MAVSDDEIRREMETLLKKETGELSEPKIKPEDLPGFGLLEGAVASGEEKRLLTLMMKALRDKEKFLRMQNMAFERLQEEFGRRDLGLSMYDVRFVSGWRIMVRNQPFAERPPGVILDRGDAMGINRSIHRAETFLNLVGRKIGNMDDPYLGTDRGRKGMGVQKRNGGKKGRKDGSEGNEGPDDRPN